MWFTPLGSDIGRDNVADTNTATLTSEDPNLRTIASIAPFTRVQINALNFAPPAIITGVGGAVSVEGGFRIHQFTNVGASTLTFSRV